MAKVSLRSYNREIENLVEKAQINEAVAHCQHILKMFPKHLETYRLLGKAYLESKRNNEAVDIFSRVLMSAPDDFVSHVGMSIVRDEENKLDDAIWHMERAFESQPANPAIQGELQRLYGRRDGMEPPKVRMTRGALAQMYVQGELYPQAIAEIRAVLAEDPQRMDMQVLLARAYFKGGQKADASDMCMQLLKRYTYCFDANRIMVELLPATAGAAESTQVYRMRVGELDPYATFAKGSVFQSSEVPDASINLERLDYKEEEPIAQGWSASLGLGVATASNEQPDWLKSGGFSEPAPEATTAPASQSSDGIPDFLRAAGWGESTNPEQPTSIFDEEPASEIAPAQMPDWLKGQVPPTEPAQPIEPTQTKSADVPDWLSGLGDAQPIEPTQTKSADVPDWLSGLDAPQSSESAQLGNDADWLNRVGETQSTEPAPVQPTPAATVESLGSTAQEQDDAVAWLESLAAKHGAKPEELVTDPSKRHEAPPEWVTQAQNINQQEPAPTQPADVPDWLSGLDAPQSSEPAQFGNDADWLNRVGETQSSEPAPVQPTPAATVESLGSTAQEQDDAVAWLESLAAKHGAKPEELVTDPSKRHETPPEWVTQAQNINQQEPAPTQPADIPDWLSGLDAPQSSESAQFGNDADWLNRVGETQSTEPAPVQPTPAATVESLGSTAQEQDDAVAWLESLAAKHGAKPEELVTDPSKRHETPPEWVTQAQNINQQEPAPTQTKSADVPDWLSGLDAPQSSESAQLGNDADWLNRVGETQSTEPAPVQPTPAATVESLGSTAQEQDDAVAWLESLAAKHGAKPEELVTDPSKRHETPPEWVTQAQNIGQQESAPVENAMNIGEQFFAEFESASAAEPISKPDQSAPAAHVEEQNLERGAIPEWLNDGVEPSLQKDFANSDSSQTDLTDWLSNLDEESGLPFDKMPTPASIAADAASNKPSAPKTDLPDWLSGVDSQTKEAADEWLPIAKEGPAPASVDLKESLPDWLQDTNEADSAPVGDDLSPWEHREKFESAQSLPTPTSPSDWKPVEPQSAPVKPAESAPAQQPVAAEPPAKKKSGLPATRSPKLEAPSGTVALDQAKSELDRGEIPTALKHYGSLIKKGKHLEETIRDLKESIYRYPVEVGIWQTLGDAYMRANRLKEALEAYNKAEELIR